MCPSICPAALDDEVSDLVFHKRAMIIRRLLTVLRERSEGKNAKC
jgi:hypothetical protein